MEYAPLNIVRDEVSAINWSKMTKEKMYKNKVLSFIEEPIHKFHRNNFIPAIEKLYFHLYRVHILGGKEWWSTIKEATISRYPHGYIRVRKYHAGI